MVSLGVDRAAVPGALDRGGGDPAADVRIAHAPAIGRGGLSVAARAVGDEPVQRLRDRPATRRRERAAPQPAARRDRDRAAADRAVRDGLRGGRRVATTSRCAMRRSTNRRFGPTSGDGSPPLCDGTLVAGSSARLTMHLDATIDLRPFGTVELNGRRVGDDFRWLAYVPRAASSASTDRPGWGPRRGCRRPGPTGSRSTRRRSARIRSTSRRSQVALTPGYRATAEDHGIEVIEGARARRCRIAVDGITFAEAFPQIE